jgi:DNA modification methylase
VSGKAEKFLAELAADLRKEIVAIARMDSALVERDIAARRREAALGRRWANIRTKIQKELERLGSSEAEWCKRELDCDIRTMRRRVQLAKGWTQYETARRDAGNNGQYGLVYGLSLLTHAEPTETGMKSHQLSVRSREASNKLDTTRCEFITGDALTEVRKMPSSTVNVVICSPPYWPVKRWYGGDGIGFELTLKEYTDNLVAVFREARRVLKNNGVFWIVMGDSYATGGGRWKQDGYKMNRPQKRLMPPGAAYPGTDHQPGSLMMLPARLAIALQEDGWLLRHEVIWDKGWVRPESARDRVTRTHDTVLMFAKGKGYFYDQDPLRVPPVRPWTTPGKHKPGLMRRDDNRRDLRVICNPMGRNVGSVWQIQRGNYHGAHTATFPPELVRRMIVSSCDDNSVVLDVFGGAGTTAMVALQLGHRAITIDINADYTREARERLANAPSLFAADTDGQEEEAASGRTYSTAINALAKPAGGNVIDLMVAKKTLGQKASRKKMSSHAPAPAKSKRAGAARAIRAGRKRA